MKRINITTAIIAATITGCAKKEEAPTPIPTHTKVPFTPSNTGNVTALQVKFWQKANVSLNNLAKESATKLSAKDSTEYSQAYREYSAEQNAIRKSSGLSGGYNEYLWISKNISKAVNRSLLDSLKLKTL